MTIETTALTTASPDDDGNRPSIHLAIISIGDRCRLSVAVSAQDGSPHVLPNACMAALELDVASDPAGLRQGPLTASATFQWPVDFWRALADTALDDGGDVLHSGRRQCDVPSRLRHDCWPRMPREAGAVGLRAPAPYLPHGMRFGVISVRCVHSDSGLPGG